MTFVVYSQPADTNTKVRLATSEGVLSSSLNFLSKDCGYSLSKWTGKDEIICRTQKKKKVIAYDGVEPKKEKWKRHYGELAWWCFCMEFVCSFIVYAWVSLIKQNKNTKKKNTFGREPHKSGMLMKQ